MWVWAETSPLTCPWRTDVLEESTVRHHTATCQPLRSGQVVSYIPLCDALTLPAAQGHMRPPQVQAARRNQ
jgi:hypothetical protein